MPCTHNSLAAGKLYDNQFGYLCCTEVQMTAIAVQLGSELKGKKRQALFQLTSACILRRTIHNLDLLL